MALNSAQRQAAYRARQRDSSETGRINTVVSIDAAAGLARLPRRAAVWQPCRNHLPYRVR